ncbi:MAG: sensor histidine kinase, partial [bacterium]
MFYRLTKVFKSEHERIVEDIKEKNSQKMNDELRRQFHDLNQHFSTLNVMLQMDKVDEARDYLSNFIGELSTIRQNIETGNTALNALLYSKVAEARENQINIRVDVINKVDGIGVSNWELTRIIGNLLDNSREALMEKEGQKEIEIIFNQNEKIYKIEVKTKGIVISHQKEKNIFA